MILHFFNERPGLNERPALIHIINVINFFKENNKSMKSLKIGLSYDIKIIFVAFFYQK